MPVSSEMSFWKQPCGKLDCWINSKIDDQNVWNAIDCSGSQSRRQWTRQAASQTITHLAEFWQDSVWNKASSVQVAWWSIVGKKKETEMQIHELKCSLIMLLINRIWAAIHFFKKHFPLQFSSECTWFFRVVERDHEKMFAWNQT